jgi:hypothetical protein
MCLATEGTLQAEKEKRGFRGRQPPVIKKIYISVQIPYQKNHKKIQVSARKFVNLKGITVRS